MNRAEQKKSTMVMAVLCVCLLLCLSACQGNMGAANTQSPGLALTRQPTATATAIGLQTQNKPRSPKPTPIPATPTPTQGQQTYQPTIQPFPNDKGHPVLAFYYPWYSTSSWCSCKMSDLPTIQYNSGDDATIERQLDWAAGAGITGFISSWWGAGDQTDQNFVKLLAHASTLEKTTGYHFASSIYFESDAPGLNGTSTIVSALRYLVAHYSNDPHFFHWQGKPVFFFWDPLGGGRTLEQWASIRSQVDPNNQMIWSAEGVDTTLLNVFDGIHLFSAGYWGIKNNTMTAVDQGFRDKIDAYNTAHQTQKIWAAGVAPGYDDTRVPGRTNTVVVARSNGATYTTSWTAAIASKPEWITITSFNEWYEGSMIEPSITYGNQYLTLTQQFTKQWHG